VKLTDLPKSDIWDDWEYVLPGADSSYYEGTTAAVPLGDKVEDVTVERIARVETWNATGGEMWCERDFVCLVELTDGSWATCMAWCDTSGWGCQQGVEWKWSASRDGAIYYGLDNDGRRRLGVELPSAGESRD
jgi:hypothetical protein